MKALLFPGQGSQQVGMGRLLAETFPMARRVYEEADAVLGMALSRLSWEGPEAALTLTAHAQPAILTHSIALLRTLEAEKGLRFDLCAGHSLGEWTALVASGALSFADAVKLVHLRGTYMQEAVPAGMGAMAALLGFPKEELAAVCAEASRGLADLVSPANLNGGGQIVIAGHAAAVERAMGMAKERGAKRAVPLAVSAPFHCALMAPAAERLSEALASAVFVDARVPVVSNVDALPHQIAEECRANLLLQVTSPVRWEECVERLVADGARAAVELGAQKVLGGLVKRIAPTLPVTFVGDVPDVMSYQEQP